MFDHPRMAKTKAEYHYGPNRIHNVVAEPRAKRTHCQMCVKLTLRAHRTLAMNRVDVFLLPSPWDLQDTGTSQSPKVSHRPADVVGPATWKQTATYRLQRVPCTNPGRQLEN